MTRALSSIFRSGLSAADAAKQLKIDVEEK
jgi:hypothetical protein